MLQYQLDKQGFSHSLLKCPNNDQATYVVRELHEGIYEGHIGIWSLIGKVIKVGY